jgi:DNA polymerase-3 subunit gamma/tau
MYQVLARKYRPQTFAEVIGQEHVTRTLSNALATGRIHHAYLFAGARGIGKTTVARILAKALNCERGPEAEPCNECPSCKQITEGSSLDVQEIDGASNTSVDDVREIRERVRYLPSSGRYKIYIIDEVHMLSTSAFNALLKTLEEPPPHVVFVFATTESHKIPATILSRCQRYDFRRIPPLKIAASLKSIAGTEGVSIEEDAMHLIAREASGSLRDGQSLFDQAIAFGGKDITAETLHQLLGFLDRNIVMNFIEAVAMKDAKTCLALLDEIYQMGADLTHLATTVLELLRNLMVIKVAGKDNKAVELPPSEVEQISRLADGLSREELEQMFNIWYDGTEQVARTQFPKTLMEVTTVRLCSVTPVEPIADIIARIDALGGKGSIPTKATPKTESKTEKHDWESFMRWLVTERPQVASVFQHGKVVNFDGRTVEIEFNAPIYSDMVMEADRKKQIDGLLQKFFGQPIELRITASSNNGDDKGPSVAKQKQHLTKEALESNLVQQAANIFDAQVHEVKTKINKE